ncbi:MAG: hypothetical protein QGF09_05705, partial [Rhodospirillales bacterium]|nr:hypothetical protein [Rhodospirillales bacterium]
LAGEGLLIWPEQSVGDQIIFCSLLPLAAKRGAACTVLCDARLLGLLSRSFSHITFLAEDGPPPPATDIDRQIPMGSLMKALAPWPAGYEAPQ